LLDRLPDQGEGREVQDPVVPPGEGLRKPLRVEQVNPDKAGFAGNGRLVAFGEVVEDRHLVARL
jgi:hypothetical protein